MKVEDARFAHLQKDPRFKKAGKEKRKVKIDNRFKHMFTAPEFSSVDFLDSRGRKEKQVTKEKMEKFYEVSSEEEDSEKETTTDLESGKKKKSRKPTEELEGTAIISSKKKKKIKGGTEKHELPVQEDTDEESDEPEEEEKVEEDEETEDEVDEKEDEMSDSSDGESTDEEETIDMSTDAWDQINTCTETTSESTTRLSICNLNWDRMNATDVFVLANSSIESSGIILSVEIFPSQYGKEQMAKENERGPAVREADNGNGQEFNTEALRKYQIERLKYHYAIVTCDRVGTADLLYKELDGVEYQLSSSILDLRFVPEDMTFGEDPPTSVCTSMPDPATYKPPTFITTALQNSSVKLTWDETEQSRLELTTKKFSANDLENIDFSAYIASSESGSDEEDSGGPSLDKYKALLASIEEGEDDEIDQEMEITWTGGLEENNQVVEEADKNEERQENATFYQPDEKDDFFATDTVIDRPKPKKKKKKKNRKEEEPTKEQSELALLMESDKDEDKKHFNMKKIIKCQKDDNFQVDLDDERFSVLKTSHLYAIDPSAPQYKETSETQKLRTVQAASLSENARTSHVAAEVSVIDKIKNRTAEFKNKKDNSKLFKTKNKNIPQVGDNVSSISSSHDEVKKKKKKKRSIDDVGSIPAAKTKKSKKAKSNQAVSS